MTFLWLALDRLLTVNKCSSTTLLSTCKRYEIIYFVYSENLQEILWITFIKTHIQIYQINHLIKSIYLSFSQWHATSNQSSYEQLICLEALLADEFSLFLSMSQLNLRMSLLHKTLTQVNNFVNELMISWTRSLKCWSS